jgi:hypothetical protein
MLLKGLMKRVLRVAICSILIGWAAASCFGQAGRGRISGLITDPTGAAVPSATVKLLNPATGVTLTTQTTGSGLYSFLSLNPGTYELTVEQTGFATVVQKAVAVQVDQTTTVNVTLHPGAVHQVVTVTSEAPLASTTNATVGQLISEQTIQRVPLVDRDVFKLVQLSPGITPVNGAVNNVEFNQRPGADVSGFSINGLPQGTLTYLEDGAPLTIAENNLGAMIPAMIPPLDSIQEYRVETSNVPASTQSFGTGVLSLVSKSGSNKFHGDGFYYGRPNFWAANDPFVKASQLEAGQPNKAPNFHRYQWGGSVGGPIIHDKLFFFGDYEGTTQRSLATGSYTVPTMAERQGDFSADSFTVYNPFDVQQTPLCATTNGGMPCRQPFPNNIIPGNMINPIASNMVQFYPKPNQPGTGPYHVNNYFASGLNPDDEEKFDIRIDDNMSARQHLFGRFSFGRLKFGNANLYGNMWNPNTYQNITNNRNVLLADDFSLTSSTLLQLRYSFTRHYENQTGDPRQVGFDMTSLGFPKALAAQSVYADIPMIDFTDWGGFTANLGSEPWTTFRFASMDHDFIAALSTIKGRHNLHMGFEYMIQLMNVGQPVAPSGWYAFDNTATSSSTWAGDGSDFASFLLGMGSAPGNEWQPAWSKDIFAAERNPYYGTYIQDDWQVSNKLTLNLGLRWDIFGGRTERYNRMEYFDPNLQYTVNGVSLKGGEVFVGPGKRDPYTTNLGNFGPRIGLAYHPFKNLVVRGGFGMFYGPSTHMVASAETNSDSFQTNTIWSATTTDAYGNSIIANSLTNPFPNGVVQPTNGKLGPATNLGTSLSTVLHSSHDPTSYNFNFGLEYQLPAGFIASAAWVGSRGLFIPGGYDLNQLSLQQVAQYGSSLGDSVPNPYLAAVTDPTSAIYQSPTIPLWESISSYPQFTSGGPNAGVGISAGPLSDSIYHSVQLKLEKRMTQHFTTLFSFMGGKLIDDGNNLLSFIGQHAGVQDWRNLNLERSLDPQDVSHWISWQASYDLPVGSGRAINLNGHWTNFWLGGWTLNSVLSFGSGVPIIVSGATNDPWFSQRPDITCNPANGAPHTAGQWFLPNCYAMPASKFLPGTGPRTLPGVRSDGTHNLDASLSKDFVFNERTRLQFQLAAFNVTNSVQLGIPNASWNPANLASFGRITYAASQPRQFQFGLRFVY